MKNKKIKYLLDKLGFSKNEKKIRTIEEEKAHRSKRNKIALIIIFPIFLTVWSIAQAGYETTVELNSLSEEKKVIIKDDKKTDYKHINKMDLWQHQQQKINDETQKKIEDISKQQLSDKQDIINTIKDSAKTQIKTSSVIQKKFEKKVTETVRNEIVKNGKFTNEKIDRLEKDLKGFVERRIKKLKLHNRPKFSTSVISSGNTQMQNNIPDIPKKIYNVSGDTQKQIEDEEDPAEELYVYEEFEEDYVVGSKVSTLRKDVNKTTEMPKFTMKKGFAEGVLLTGATLKTLGEGKGDPKPVHIKITSHLVYSGKYSANLKGCILQAGAIGEFGTSRAELRISGMECTVKKAGKEYILAAPVVKGWVFDEDSDYGIDSRMVTKEAEILAKSIPLAILQAGMKGLTKSISNKAVLANDSTTSTNTNTLLPVSDSLEDSADDVTKRIADHWFKYLDAMVPTVEFRAGRKLFVGFEGGEEFQWKESFNNDIEVFMEKLDNRGEIINGERTNENIL